MTITIISTTAQLIAALHGAVAGDTIELAPGTYSGVSISSARFSAVNNTGPSDVYIRSEFSNNEAVVTDMSILNSQNIIFSGLKLSTANDAVGAGGPGGTDPFSIVSSGGIKLSGMQMMGNPNGTLENTVSGLLIEKSSYVYIEDSSFSYLHGAIGQLNNGHISILDNSFSHIYDDGIRGGGTSNITISGNTFTDFHPDLSDTEHPDLIQFWTTGTTAPTSNITITDNTFTRGTGNAPQGILMNDEVGDLPYSNVQIIGNSFAGTQYNGIAVYDVHNGTIFNNTLVSYTDYTAQLNVYNSKSVRIENNSAGEYNYGGSSELTLVNNVVTPPVGAVANTNSRFAIRSLSITSPAPEAQTWALMGLGLSLLGACVRGARRRVGVLIK